MVELIHSSKRKVNDLGSKRGMTAVVTLIVRGNAEKLGITRL